MSKKKFNRAGAIAKIKVCQKELGLSDDDYREMLAVQTGKTSSARLTVDELKHVLDHLSRFVGLRQKAEGKQYLDNKNYNLRILYAKARKGLGPDWRKRLTGLCEKLAGKSVPEWCTNDEVVQLFSAVGRIARRENVPEKNKNETSNG
jgi:phage gp16-like protein